MFRRTAAWLLPVALAASLLAAGALGADAPKSAAAKPPKGELTDEDVTQAIEKGRQYLISRANADGSFEKGGMKGGHSVLAFMTLAYMGEHPNREVMTKGLDYILNVDAETGFDKRQGYAVPIRIMGLSYILPKLLGDKRTLVRQKMMEDVLRLQVGQATNGGWRYELKPNNDYDFSVTQWPILAMREANLVGIEFPPEPLIKARDLYYKRQKSDGGWSYQDKESYGSMTAAGVASLYIIADVLEPASGCPCKGGASQRKASETERRMESGLEWLAKHFTAKDNPGKGSNDLYWLYCVERVGIAAGYKYFGTHNWYREGVEAVLAKQGKEGNWGDLPDTCFVLLFLYKGRAPVLFNKLKFDGEWNAHRRDIANLTTFIERTKEQQFHWQIVELRAPLEELHDAPILYITPESLPKWTDADKKKLRQFTDTGGTILFEASCGNPAVRKWFTDFAREVWPEWPLARLPVEHGVWQSQYPMKEKPEILGIDDGVRTAVFYSPDDISCAWQTKALTAKGYLFNWGINLYTYATDGAPLRAKLSGREPAKTNRFNSPVKAGPRTTLSVARLKHSGNWEVGANYGGLRQLADHLKSTAGITLQVKEPTEPPFTSGGTALADLAADQVAYLAGSGDFVLKPAEKEALKAYLEKGGFLWAEAVTGAPAFGQAVRKVVGELGLEMRLLPPSHGLMTGRMDPGLGYNLAANVKFHRTFEKKERVARPYAEFYGLFQGDKMVGVFSPFDILYSLTGHEAYWCRGYLPEDAAAVATNLAVYLSTPK